QRTGPSGDRHHPGDPGFTLAIVPGVTLAIRAPRRTLTLAIHTAGPGQRHLFALVIAISLLSYVSYLR
ncbi:MAG: hypothetical protein KC495_03160, partial [Dehalococcoidia bacterium]|nr:hypothetical protein [Dehalococcoidia bacterium]